MKILCSIMVIFIIGVTYGLYAYTWSINRQNELTHDQIDRAYDEIYRIREETRRIQSDTTRTENDIRNSLKELKKELFEWRVNLERVRSAMDQRSQSIKEIDGILQGKNNGSD